jgi:hypothetical protein
LQLSLAGRGFNGLQVERVLLLDVFPLGGARLDSSHTRGVELIAALTCSL